MSERFLLEEPLCNIRSPSIVNRMKNTTHRVHNKTQRPQLSTTYDPPSSQTSWVNFKNNIDVIAILEFWSSICCYAKAGHWSD